MKGKERPTKWLLLVTRPFERTAAVEQMKLCEYQVSFGNLKYLGLEGVLLDAEVGGLLGGTDGFLSLLLGCKGPAEGTGLLGTDVLRRVFLSLAELPDSLLHLGVVNGEDTSDGLPDNLDLHKLGSGSTSDLGDAEGGKLELELVELLEELLLGLLLEFVGLNSGHICRLNGVGGGGGGGGGGKRGGGG